MSAIRGAFPKGIHAFCFILVFATLATLALLLLEAFAPYVFNPNDVHILFFALSVASISIVDPMLFKGGIHYSLKVGINTTTIVVVAVGVYFGLYMFIMDPLGISHFYIVAFALIVIVLSALIKMPAANCAVFGVFLLSQDSFFTMVPLAFAAGVGFTASLVMFAAIRERLIIDGVVPVKFDGVPLAVAVALVMALVLFGLTAF